MNRKISKLVALTLFLVAVDIGQSINLSVNAKSFELGVQEKQYLDSAPPLSGYANSYPAPQMIQQAPSYGSAQKGFTGSAAKPAPLQGSVSKTLPAGFLGSWMVEGQRTKVDAQPEFQGAAEQAFAPTTSNTWIIKGSGQAGYTIGSDTGMDTQLWVDKVANGVAFLRYQHPVKNTVAQEAIVMQLGPKGASFSGLERISIIKQVEGQRPLTRCKVQYQLTGQRQ
jgi:hypothetical protein